MSKVTPDPFLSHRPAESCAAVEHLPECRRQCKARRQNQRQAMILNCMNRAGLDRSFQEPHTPPSRKMGITRRFDSAWVGRTSCASAGLVARRDGQVARATRQRGARRKKALFLTYSRLFSLILAYLFFLSAEWGHPEGWTPNKGVGQTWSNLNQCGVWNLRRGSAGGQGEP